MTKQNKNYDLAIIGGRVMDPETELDAVRNVGVKGDKIAAISEEALSGKKTIDAAGHVVAPGFIDMHSHNSGDPFGQKLAVLDGVTTPLELEAGSYPVESFYAALEGKSRTNYGVTISTLGIREHVLNPDYKTKFAGYFIYDVFAAAKEAHVTMKWSTKIATNEQIEEIGKLLEEGIKQGALGIGHAVGYMTAGCTVEESFLCQKLAGKYGLSTFLHGRFSSQMPPTSSLLSIAEMMTPQAVDGGGLNVQHITAQTLNETPAALQIIDDAREKGFKIIAEVYPYNFGGSIVGADYLQPANYQTNMGRTYSDIIETATMKPMTKERYEELVKSNPATSIMFYNATEETVWSALAHPSTVVGSDAMPFTIKADGKTALDWDTPFDAVNGHPRGAGAHARMLRLVREKKIDIPLMLGISKMTYMIARYLEDNGVDQMADKGRIQVGKDADITLFDPETVIDNSTMEHGGLPSTGIPYVLVNGTVVVRDSKTVDDVFPGKPIRLNKVN